MKKRQRDDAITVLSVILLILAGVAGAILVFHLLTPHHTSTPHGLVAMAVRESGDSVRLTGDLVGYSSVPRTVSGFYIRPSKTDEKAIGAIQLSISPIIGDMAIDMDLTRISVIEKNKETALTLKKASPLNPGDWAIISRYGYLPFGSANDDDILHAGETFDLLITLPEPLHPEESFSLVIAPAGGVPLHITKAVPVRVTAVTTISN
ncbi:hypothetical protein FTO68_07145 [Methanocalculus taiwanensis]|uniref:Flagellin n=1 Tax=Methanocalculus taiwanensis TaxID=106207 RepID=A0ABD4TLV6_9EURY|nr:flagellin [Methanocalculus taiwanensis]MCQ1538758.1 hypothetical protein [Methanocalculus taiwanensis]